MSDSAPPATYQYFSLRRVMVLAGSTFTQLVRMKVFFFLAIFAFVLIAASFVFADLQSEQELKVLKDISLAAMSIFSMLFAVTGTALLIPKDIEDRTLYTILCKPVPRLEYLLGKLFGVVWLILLSLIAMDLLFSAVLWMKQNAIISDQLSLLEAAANRIPKQELETQKQALIEINAKQGLTWTLQAGVLSIFLKAFVLAGASLLMSTIASTTMFTIMSSLGVLLIGHAQAIARDYLLADAPQGAISRLIAGAVAILFPDFKTFDITEAAVLGTHVPPVVLLQMTGLAAVYFAVHMIAAVFVFSDKEL